MEMNLVGQYYKTPDDLFRELMRRDLIKYDITHILGTKQGISIEHPVHGKADTNCNGFYVIYKFGQPVYVGHTAGKNTIHTRLSRWVKTLLGNNTEKEDHPAAKKYIETYGNSLNGISVLVYPVKECLEEVDAEMVETRLIQEFRPKFNKNGTTFRRRSTCYKEKNKKCNAAIKSAIKAETVHFASLEKFLE